MVDRPPPAAQAGGQAGDPAGVRWRRSNHGPTPGSTPATDRRPTPTAVRSYLADTLDITLDLLAVAGDERR
jgi:hypothetical protein